MKTIKIILVMVMTMVCVSMNAQRWTYDRVVAERNHRELVKSIDKLTEATKELTRATKEANGYSSSSSSYHSYSNKTVRELCPKDDKVYIYDSHKGEMVETTDSTNRKINTYYRNGKEYLYYPTEFVLLIEKFRHEFFLMMDVKLGMNINRHKFYDKGYKSLFKEYNLSQKKAREEFYNLDMGYSCGGDHFKTKEDCRKAIADLQAFKEKYKEILKR